MSKHLLAWGPVLDATVPTVSSDNKPANDTGTLATLFAPAQQAAPRGLGALFLSNQHRGTIETLLRAIQQGRPVITLLGEPGIGKTTLLHGALARLREPAVRVIRFDAPMRFGLLHGAFSTMSATQRTVLAIDGAQTLPPRILRYLALKASWSVAAGIPVNVVLVGRPELAAVLAQSELGALAGGAPVLLSLSPFTPEEAVRYVEHRVMLSGYPSRQVITPRALRIISQGSEGVPAQANRLMDLAVTEASERSEDWITAPVARSARSKSAHEATGRFTGVTPMLRNIVLAGVAASAIWLAYEALAPNRPAHDVVTLASSVPRHDVAGRTTQESASQPARSDLGRDITPSGSTAAAIAGQPVAQPAMPVTMASPADKPEPPIGRTVLGDASITTGVPPPAPPVSLPPVGAANPTSVLRGNSQSRATNPGALNTAPLADLAPADLAPADLAPADIAPLASDGPANDGAANDGAGSVQATGDGERAANTTAASGSGPRPNAEPTASDQRPIGEPDRSRGLTPSTGPPPPLVGGVATAVEPGNAAQTDQPVTPQTGIAVSVRQLSALLSNNQSTQADTTSTKTSEPAGPQAGAAREVPAVQSPTDTPAPAQTAGQTGAADADRPAPVSDVQEAASAASLMAAGSAAPAPDTASPSASAQSAALQPANAAAGSAEAGVNPPVERLAANATAASGPASTPSVVKLSDALIATLVRRGQEMRSTGDISAARLLFDRAAEAGNAAAAAEAGRLRDPAYLTQLGAVGVAADPLLAAGWYRRAMALGNPEASSLLQHLQEAAR